MNTESNSLQTYLRMRDVGLVLYEAQRYGQLLNKTQLQKNIYLVDSVTLLFDLLPIRQGHLTYKRGPYDSAIQNAADCLVFRGLVKLASTRRGSQGEVFVQYDLTSAGLRWIESLVRSSVGREKSRIAAAVAAQVNVYGWSRLLELVYAEPTYVFSRSRGYGQRLKLLSTAENSAANIIRLMSQTLRQGWAEIEITPEVVVRLFFQYLDKYHHATRAQGLSLAGGGVTIQ